MKNMFKPLALFILVFLCCVVSAQQITWTEIHPGVWKGIVGKPEAYDLIKASGAQSNKEALAKITKAAFPLTKEDIAVTK